VNLSGYLAVARRWWWTLLVAAWIAGLTGYVVGSQIPPTYETRVKLLVGPINADFDTIRASGQLVQTYAELVTSQPLLESAVDELGLELNPSRLRQNVRATADDVTRFLTIRVQDSDAERAARIANTLADELRLLASGGVSRPEGELQITEFADVPGSPIAPQVPLIASLAAGAGLVGALLMVLLIEYLADTVRTREDIVRLGAGPTLGTVPARRDRSVPGLTPAPAGSPAAMSYRLLGAKVQLDEAGTRLRSVVTVPVDADDPGPEVALNLATAISETGRTTVLVDAAGELSRLLGEAGEIGLADCLRDDRLDPTALLREYAGRLALLPVGLGDVNLISAEQARTILERLLDGVEAVVLSGGYVLGASGTLVWARAVERALLVGSLDRSRRASVTGAVEGLGLVGGTIGGSILVERPPRTAGNARGRWGLGSLRWGAPAGDAAGPAAEPGGEGSGGPERG
jgi:succinoglycan biosynthesis transport protein ExoP